MNTLNSTNGNTFLNLSQTSTVTTTATTSSFNGWKRIALTTTLLACMAVVDAKSPNCSTDTLRPFGSMQSNDVEPLFQIEPQVSNWLSENVDTYRSNLLSKLYENIAQVFGNVSVRAHLHQDPEENWMKPIVSIESQLGDDFDAQFAREEELFNLLWQSDDMRTLVKRLIIRQV